MVILLLFAVVSSCKTRYITTEVPVEMHDTITSIKTVHSIDTIERLERIHVFDTMYIDTSTISTLGMPTLRHERSRLIDNTSKQNHSADTTSIIERIIEKPVVVHDKEYIEINTLYWWQKALMWAGVFGIVMALFLIAFIIWRIRR